MPKTAAIVLVLTLALAGCGKPPPDAARDLNQLDEELVDNAVAVDPALTGAIESQIMVDPTLARRADGRAPDAGRAPLPPAEMIARHDAPAVTGLVHAPDTVPCQGKDCRPGEITLGELARSQAARPRSAGAVACNPDLAYSFAWAARLPSEFPVYPQAQVSEAAGGDLPGCHVRVVSFATAAARGAVTDYYYTRALKAHYSADHVIRAGDHVLAGTRGGDAYYLILSDRPGGGTDVDMIVNRAH